MSEREEEQEVKVNDRRKFNLDGSLREGVVLTEAKPKVEEPPAETPVAPVDEPPAPDNIPDMPENFPAEPEDEDFDGGQIPGAEDPASFANFLLSLASQAAAALGMTEHPATGQRRMDLELSKYWIDILGMLREKTANNLHPQEQKLFDGVLNDLRMQFVALTRAEVFGKRYSRKKMMSEDWQISLVGILFLFVGGYCFYISRNKQTLKEMSDSMMNSDNRIIKSYNKRFNYSVEWFQLFYSW